MKKRLQFIKRMVYPVSLFTIFMAVSLIGFFYALFLILRIGQESTIYLAVMVPVTALMTLLYLIDRFLLTRLPYWILMFTELILACVIFFFSSFQNRTVDICFHTDQDFVMVIFDANGKAISDFSRKGIFGKRIDYYDCNIAIIDTSLSNKMNIRIIKPPSWTTFEETESFYELRGRRVKCILSSQKRLEPGFVKNREAYLDSLLRHVPR